MMNSSIELYCESIQAPTELSVFTALMSVLITLLSAIGNGVIIMVIIRNPLKNLNTPFNYFLVNLAFSDLIIGIITSPLSVYLHSREITEEVSQEIKVMFRLPYFLSITASILSLGALCLDRFLAITFPIMHRNGLTWKRCGIISAGIWLFSLTVPFAYFKVGFVVYLIIYANSCVLLALIILSVTYVKVYKSLRKQTTELRNLMDTEESTAEKFRLKRLVMEKRVTRAFLVILVLFICTYLPAAVMIYIIYFCKNCDCTFIHVIRDLEILLILANSCMNPFVCTIRLTNFRQSIKALWSCKVHTISSSSSSSRNSRNITTANVTAE